MAITGPITSSVKRLSAKTARKAASVSGVGAIGEGAEHPLDLPADVGQGPIPHPHLDHGTHVADEAYIAVVARHVDAQIGLTVRHDDLPQHAGQVSLPGGAREPDEDLTAAALREGEEEVGLDPKSLRVLGHLSPLHIPASGFVLHPVVAHGEDRPTLHPADGEVERILEVSLGELRDPARIRVERRFLQDRHYDVPYFDLHGEKVWGATAMVLAELLWLLGSPPDPWGPD